MILWITPRNLGDLKRVRTKEPGKQRFWGQQDSSLPSQVEQLYRMVLPPAGDNRSSAGKRSHGRLPTLPPSHPRFSGSRPTLFAPQEAPRPFLLLTADRSTEI